MTDQEILDAAKYVLHQHDDTNPYRLDRVWGWNNIVENEIWHYLKEKKGWTKFPNNLYTRIRKVIYDSRGIDKEFDKLNRY